MEAFTALMHDGSCENNVNSLLASNEAQMFPSSISSSGFLVCFSWNIAEELVTVRLQLKYSKSVEVLHGKRQG